MPFIAVQEGDFDVQQCYQRLRQEDGCGAIVTFTGVVREFAQDKRLTAIELEQYPAMTHSALERLCETAEQRFNTRDIVLIHRVGRLAADEQIVFVGVACPHRKAAFEACQFIMDTLKRDVPLWKKEIFSDGKSRWVEAKSTDIDAANQW